MKDKKQIIKVPDYNSCKLKNLNVKIAIESVKCYKIFKVHNGIYYGPYTHYSFGKLKTGDIIHPDFDVDNQYKKHSKLFNFGLKNIERVNWLFWLFGDISYNIKNKWWDIRGGYLHSLSYCPSNMKDYVWTWDDEWNSYPRLKQDFELWECEVPSGTFYFQADTRGSHSESCNSIASKELKIVKRIDTCAI